MRKRTSRVQALKPASEGTQKTRILFADLVVGAEDDFVDLESCIPFTKIRSLTSSGVRRLVASFTGKLSPEIQDDCTSESYQSTGLVHGSELPMVVRLTASLLYFVEDHFRDQGLKDEEVNERIKSRSEWYGIVDGLHSHAALTYIKANNSRWSEFRWYVKKLNEGFPIEKYRQLSRVQNSRHHPSFYVELTLFDVLYNLRLEHETLKREKKKCGGSETAHAYDGALHARNSTLQQKANISIRLPIAVLKEMGNIMNSDHPDIILASKGSAKYGAKTEEQLMERVDCRRYRSFINISTLKGSPMFMNANEKDSEEVQINTLHRIKDMYLLSNFKTIQSDDLTKQFKYATLAQKEQEKFLRFLECDEWPKEMESIKINMLRSFMLDKELDENAGNDFVILPKLLQSFKRHFPDMAALKMAKWKACTEEVTTPKTPTTTPEISKEERCDTASDTANDTASDANVCDPTDIHEENKDTMNENDVLTEKNINGFNLDWGQYMTDEITDKHPKFDFLLTSPPSAPSRSYIRSMKPSSSIEEIEKPQMQEFCSFIKRVMKTGSYVILLIHFTMFQEWYEVLDSNGLMVMPNEFIITYDPQTVKRRKVSHFGQSAHDIALIAKIQGAHPSGFMPPFEEENEEDGNSMSSKRLALLRNAPATRSFLCKHGTKVPFDTREFHPAIFKAFIELYCPEGGSVLDPFARTMTCGLASLRTRRSCCLLEKRSDCYEAAMARLRDAATPLLSTILLTNESYTPPSSSLYCTTVKKDDSLDESSNEASSCQTDPNASTSYLSVAKDPSLKPPCPGISTVGDGRADNDVLDRMAITEPNTKQK